MDRANPVIISNPTISKAKAAAEKYKLPKFSGDAMVCQLCSLHTHSAHSAHSTHSAPSAHSTHSAHPANSADAQDVINDPDVEAVWICSPSQFHADQIKATQ